MDAEDIELYKMLFKEADLDGDGYLSSEELGKALGSFGEKMPQKQVDLIVKLVDRDNNGKLDLNEFLDMLSENIGNFETEEEIKRLFHVFDRNNSGFITREDLIEVMNVMDEKVDEAEIDEAIKDADKNGDGKINIDEFLKVMNSFKK